MKFSRRLFSANALLLVLFLGACLSSRQGVAQEPAPHFSHQDTLRGSITPERAWWDVLQYNIRVEPDYLQQTIKASNEIVFRVLQPGRRMQIDLQEPMQITTVRWEGKSIPFERDSNVFYLEFPENLVAGSQEKILISYEGKPRVARNPPWDGGWIWKKDEMGRPWMSVACQGLGASVWYPCKDHQSDEPDEGASLAITVPDTLVAVGNGRLVKKEINSKNHLATYTWRVVSPINNYDIIPYIGKYVNWHEVYPGEKGPLDCSYWVLDYDLAKAREQFKQVPLMLHCFEYWFGPYPFYADGYKLVQAPHLGMEHQSAVAYGNHFQNGYLGRDLSGTGWGLKWDFIIVHESGHEWFGNNITSKDLADMWIHEGFTNYSETIFTQCQYGKAAGDAYCIGTRSRIRNDRPIIAHYGVNEEGSGDMYYKGGNMIHTIRQVINNDSLFRQILRGLNSRFYHQTVTESDIENYINEKSGINFTPVFREYLTTTMIPVLEYRWEGKVLHYHWAQVVPGFAMPVKVTLHGKTEWLHPDETWKSLQTDGSAQELKPDPNFYIRTKSVQ